MAAVVGEWVGRCVCVCVGKEEGYVKDHREVEGDPAQEEHRRNGPVDLSEPELEVCVRRDQLRSRTKRISAAAHQPRHGPRPPTAACTAPPQCQRS